MKPKATRILTTLLLAIALAGCKGGGGASEKKLKLAFVPNNSATFWVIARAGCEQAAKELPNVEVDFRMPSTGGAGEQQQIMDDLVAKGIDGIAVSPIDPANQTAFLDKIAGQTLLVCHDSDAPKSKRVCYIGTDNFASGIEAGKLLKEALPNGGKIMAFVGNADADNAQQRYAGIKKELEGTKIEVIDLRSDDIDIVRAQKNAEDTLVKYPDIAGMVGLYAYNGPAILNAVRSANMVGKVKIVCFDEDDATLNGVAAGEIHGTVVQQPFEFGRQAITRMAKYLGGDKDALAGGRQIVPTRSLRKDDIAAFKAELSKITGK